MEGWAGQTPNYARMRAYTTKMLEAARLPSELRENWHKRFNNRHDEIKAVNVRHVEPDRANACNSKTILAWFKKLKQIKHEYKINDSNCYNIEERGIQMGDTKREKVFCVLPVLQPLLSSLVWRNEILLMRPFVQQENTSNHCSSSQQILYRIRGSLAIWRSKRWRIRDSHNLLMRDFKRHWLLLA